jgi:YVTN family beta-propeller protein
VALDLAKDSLVGLDASSHQPDVALPLPGRPTALTVAGARIYITTVDSAALTVFDARTRSIVRTIPVSLKPAAVAVDRDRVWVLDGRRGVVAGFRAGYERPAVRIAYRRSARLRSGDHPAESASLAAGAGAVWATDGSSRLWRIDPRAGRMSDIPAGLALDGVAIGDGAVWAFSARRASVVRVDPRTRAVTDVIPIVTRSGPAAPFPIGIATTPGSVWVLNGNTATVTRIDARQRGVTATVAIGMDRAPRAIAAAADTVWVANFDGSVSRLGPRDRTPSSLWVGESLGRVSATGGRVWVTTTALDRQLPGGTA